MASESVTVTNTFKNTNRYCGTRIHVDDSVSPGRKRLGIWRAPEVNIEEATRAVVSRTWKKRIDIFAHGAYDNVNQWWAIARASNIKDIFCEMTTGTPLLVPVQTAVTQALQEMT